MFNTFIDYGKSYRSHEYACERYKVCIKPDVDNYIFECRCDIVDGYSTKMISIEYMMNVEYVIDEIVRSLCGHCKYRNCERV